MTRNYEERKIAVEYCIAHGRNYTLTAVHFGLTYQQVYMDECADIMPLDRMDQVVPRRAAEDKKFKTAELELELEMKRALHQKLRQHHRQSCDAVNLSGVRYTTEYQIVKELHEEKKWPIYKLCAMLGVSRAAYYKWCRRTASAKQQDDEKLAQHINEIYQSQHGIPGYRQMKIILERRFGLKCNLKRVHRLMSALGLRFVCKRKKWKRPRKTSSEYIEENVLNREFSARRPNEFPS